MSANFFCAPLYATYVFVFSSLAVGGWYAYPLFFEVPDVSSVTIVYSAPLALKSTEISLNSVKLALEEVNYMSDTFGIKLEVLDDGDATGAWNETKERANAHRAAKDERVVAYLGPLNSGAAKVSMPILNQAGILQLSPSNTWPGLTKAGFLPGEPGVFYPTGTQHYLRVVPTDDLQGPAGARWASDEGFSSVFVVNDTDPYGVGISKLFEQESRKLGMTVVASEGITTATSSWEGVGNRIVALTASSTATSSLSTISPSTTLVYYGGSTPNGGPQLLKYIRERGSHVAFMGPDGIFETDFITQAGDASEGVYITAIGISPEEVPKKNAQTFVTKYRERFKGETPDVFGAFAYDATKALIASLGRTTGDRASILADMRQPHTYAGIFGEWSFDKNGDTTLTLISGNKIQNGAFVYVRNLAK